MTSPHDQSGLGPAKSPIEIAVEALRLSSSMLEAMQVQLCSWGHDPSVNVDGQRDKNTEAIAALSQPVAAEAEALIGKLERAAENKYLNSQSLVSVLRYSNIEETLEGKAAAMLHRLSLPVAGEGWREGALATKEACAKIAADDVGSECRLPKNIKPEEPCPVCGDLGTFSKDAPPSMCVGYAKNRIAAAIREMPTPPPSSSEPR